VHYHVANLWIKNTDVKTAKHAGCRNSSYGREFNQSRKDKISKQSKGRVRYNNGVKEICIAPGDTVPPGFVKGRLPFSDETKQKLRNIIIDLQNKGIMRKGADAARRGWQNGKFNNVNFKRGIGGWITTNKYEKRFFFRSLLELYYIIQLEEDPDVITYTYEPFIIKCDDNTLYTPDFLINDCRVVELKSKKFVYKCGGKILERFLYKVDQGKKYCNEHGYTYEVIFDEDIGFDSARFKQEIRNSDYIKKYNIQFAQPERVWSKK
jgi:hypothetical protein